ncbi:MAG: c-type cytochrome [Saprospiraceae bacterium]|nr:c-type cytochrome [Saprospiraceae bacterium]MBL0099419.1 c-type cytochrome [Saprospiraceae bacterium]
MIYKHLKIKSIATILFMWMTLTLSAAVSADAGKELFKNNCAACHSKDMRSAATGPALGGSQARWADDVALYKWIRNSQAMIQSGHPRSVELWNQYKPTVMTAFPKLTDDEIGSLLAYVNGVYDGTYGPKKDVAAGAGAAVKTEEKSQLPLYLIIAAVLAVLALLLTKIISNLNQIAAAKDGEYVEAKTISQILTSKGVVTFLIFAAIILGAYTTVNKATELGRQEGYAPDQPIKFSHATHAGVNKIDCQYCHDSARRSKHSSIPGTNTCMNCHAAIKNGSAYGTAEITKIYASIGYDPATNKYIENYESKTEDEIKAIYTKWIGDEYKRVKEKADLDSEGERIVSTQWADIKKSLTNDRKKQIQGPIEWVKIHNLPDHVYFNHAQHVTVGKLECQTCHGKVEGMEVLKQMSPLSMGWCINCHRQTEVKFKDNAYYANYTRYHEELASGKRDKVTVADIGGLECAKCHY